MGRYDRWPVAETVELATIWLVDLVGSTRLATAVGPVRGIPEPRTWEARSELAWAEALADRSEPDRAREHASRALELSRDHGYGAFEPRAAAIVASGAAIHP